MVSCGVLDNSDVILIGVEEIVTVDSVGNVDGKEDSTGDTSGGGVEITTGESN